MISKILSSHVILTVFCFLSICVSAQDADTNAVDASKPTNLYTQVNAAFEYQSNKDGDDLYGTRINVQYAFNPDNLLLVEVPFLYNEGTDKFGISDTRVRYFHAAKRNITKRLIAIAPYADITIPTGSLSNGLGGDVWSLAAGVVAGYVISPKIAMFPGVGFVHVTDSDKRGVDSQNGINFQTNMSISFTPRSFLFVNPIVTVLDRTLWTAEFNYNYMITPNKLKVNAGYYPNFSNDINTFRLGATLYL
jgi:opacity protein-like surface antigen